MGGSSGVWLCTRPLYTAETRPCHVDASTRLFSGPPARRVAYVSATRIHLEIQVTIGIRPYTYNHSSSALMLPMSRKMNTDSSTRISRTASFSRFFSHCAKSSRSLRVNNLSSSCITSVLCRFSNTAFSKGSSCSDCRRAMILQSVLYRLPTSTV